jgi:serine/threonine protein kinase
MYDKKTFYLVMDCLFLTFFLFYFINIIGALSLIQYCLKPDPNTRATTKDILRHDWLAHGPVLSIRLNSTTSSNESDKNRLQPNSLSPTNSLVELELHTSSFFDSTRLRDNSSINKEQQRRNRVSAIPISTRYLSSNNTKNSSTLSRPTYRRPISLSMDDQSSAATHRYTLAESTTPSSSYDLDSAINDLKSRYTPPKSNVKPQFSNPTTTLAPSVFTTSAIKFAPAPARRMSPLRDEDNSFSTNSTRLLNNPSSHIDDSIYTTNNNQRSLLTSLELPTTFKNRLLDDNNNLVSSKIYE